MVDSLHILYMMKSLRHTLKKMHLIKKQLLALSTSMDYQHRSMRCYMEVIVMSKAWGGRFEAQPEDWVDDFNASIDFDKNLINQDVRQYCTCNDARESKYYFTRRSRGNY